MRQERLSSQLVSHLSWMQLWQKTAPLLVELPKLPNRLRKSADGLLSKKTSAQFMIPSRCQILYPLEDHIGGFMDIFSYESARRIGDQNVLRKVDALMDWSAISVLLKNGLKRSGLGPQGYKEITLFKCLLIGQWHNLSDPKLEESLRVRFDFMLFAGLDLHGSVPDETTHCRFRNALVKADAYDALLAEVCRQIENHGLR